MSDENLSDLFSGLKALAETAFPKHCNTCGKVYESVEQYTRETVDINGKKGLKAVEDEGINFLEVYRNCICGSTLMDVFQDRRDMTEKGLKRRNGFEKVLQYIISQNIEKEVARNELLKVLRNQKSEFLESKGIKLK